MWCAAICFPLPALQWGSNTFTRLPLFVMSKGETASVFFLPPPWGHANSTPFAPSFAKGTVVILSKGVARLQQQIKQLQFTVIIYSCCLRAFAIFQEQKGMDSRGERGRDVHSTTCT